MALFKKGKKGNTGGKGGKKGKKAGGGNQQYMGQEGEGYD